MKKMRYSYDKEGDILAVEISKEPFDYAEEMGDFIIHFTKGGKPVYVEILNARKFIVDSVKRFPKETLRNMSPQILPVQ